MSLALFVVKHVLSTIFKFDTTIMSFYSADNDLKTDKTFCVPQQERFGNINDRIYIFV